MNARAEKQKNQEEELRAYEFVRHAWRHFGEEAMLSAALNLWRVPPSDELTTNEQAAADAAAEKAGEYLMDIDKTDFAEMTEEERDEFLRQFLIAYRFELRKKIESIPPF